MKEESRIEALEHELKILKNEIHTTLIEIREQILNHYYPELRAEEPMHHHSLPVRPKVGRPGAPAKSTSRTPDGSSTRAEIEAKGQVQPFSDIFLEDLSEEDEDDQENDASNQALANSRPTLSRINADLDDALEDNDDEEGDEDIASYMRSYADDEDGEDETNEDESRTVKESANGTIKVQKITPSSQNNFGRAPQTREVDFRQLKQTGATSKPAANPAPQRAEPSPESRPAKTGHANFAALATWVNEGVSKVGKERTTQIVETYATGGKLSSETKNSLLQLIALAPEEELPAPIGSQEMLGLMVGLDQILR